MSDVRQRLALSSGASASPTYHSLPLLENPAARREKRLWKFSRLPSMQEIDALLGSAYDPAEYRRVYADFATQNSLWNQISGGTGHLYEWDPSSLYIREPSGPLQPRQSAVLAIERRVGRRESVRLTLRIDTPIEVAYFSAGGILPYVERGDWLHTHELIEKYLKGGPSPGQGSCSAPSITWPDRRRWWRVFARC